MRRRYEAPDREAAYRAAIEALFSPDAFILTREQMLEIRRREYEALNPGEALPTFEEWLAVREAPVRACLQCGCDGQRGSFHGGGDGD